MSDLISRKALINKLKEHKDLFMNEKPTTNNDLGVREFEEIVIEYPPEGLCTYPEYRGKPYFSIKYKEGNDCFIGYGTYNLKVFSRYLRDYFMPSVTPQSKTGHWIPVSETVDTLQEIKNQIGEMQTYKLFLGDGEKYISRDEVLRIIDEKIKEYAE